MNEATPETIRHPLSRVLLQRPEGPMRVPARALGWFSIALGLAELAMPRVMSRAAGMPRRTGLMRVYGLREIGTGVGLLTSKDPAPWLWGRVAGDALDIVTVSTALVSPRGRPGRALASLVMLAGITALDAACAQGAKPKKLAQHSGHDYSSRSGFPKSFSEMRGAGLQPARVTGGGRVGGDNGSVLGAKRDAAADGGTRPLVPPASTPMGAPV